MKDSILISLAERWESDADSQGILAGSDKEALLNATQEGYQECKRECADALRVLVSLLGTYDDR